MAEEQETTAPVFFRDKELEFITWFYCTTTLRSSRITKMLNTHHGTNFNPGQVREVLNEIKRIRPGRPRYKAPKENWICPRHFGIHCFDYQRPEEELIILARHHFVGTLDQFRCCSQEAVTSGSDSDRDSGEFPDPYPTRTTIQEVETSSTTAIFLQAARTRKLSILLAFTVSLPASLTFIYYYNTMLLSIRHRWPIIRDHIIETTVENYHHVIFLKTHLQTNLDRPYLFLLYCILLVLLLGKTNNCLSSLSPITLQPLNPTPTNSSTTYKKWLSNHFPYFFLRNPTAHHRSLTLSNLLIIPKSFLHDAFHATILFIFFYFGWLTSKLNCPHIHIVESTRGQIHVHGWGIFKELLTSLWRCTLPNPRLGEFARVGALFMVYRYMFMVFFWVIAAIPVVVERFQVGYRGE